MSRVFRPWRRDFGIGLAIFLLAGLGIYLADTLAWRFGFLCLAIIGWAFVKRGANRFRGKRVEQFAIQDVSLPDGWVARPNFMVAGLGDLDLMIEAPDKQRFAVEIKSYNGVKKAWFSDSLRKLNGDRITPDPVAQVRRLADRTEATPVIWLPRALGPTLKLSGGLMVVQGGERRLRRAIGAGGWLF